MPRPHGGGERLRGKGGQRTTFSTLNNAIFNDHPADAAGADLACAYYGRRLRSLSVGDVVAAGDVLLAVGRPAGWVLVSGGLTEVRTSEHGTRPLPERSRPLDAAGDAAGPGADEGGS